MSVVIGMIAAAAMAASAVEDVSVPVRPGCSERGVPFWNVHATFFRYAPSFDFKAVSKAVRYRFSLKGGSEVESFEADSPEAPLSPVWSRLANVRWTVVCEGIGADGAVVGKAGERSFVKTAPYAGGCAQAARPYREAARGIYEYMTSLPAMKTLVETGVPEQGYQHNAYPSKTHAAHIKAMLTWAKADPQNGDKAMRFARASGEYLLSQLEPADAPLAFWPPTYGRKPLECDPKADGGERREAMVGNDPEGAAKYRGQVMALYPADVGLQFIALAEATGEKKYLEAAKGIGETYLRIRRADGTWALKYWLATGEVQCPNPLVPTRPMAFFERLAEATGDGKWRKAADECFAWLERGPLSDWNWDGQFEDIEPRPPYQDLTKHNAIETMLHILGRSAGDPAARKTARELLRWSEDQFVFWEAPCRADEKVPCAGSGRPFAPGKWHYPSVFEQYSCYIAIDASASKMIAAYLAMYKAEGNPLDLAKARALADAITQMQEPSGRVPTFWAEKENWLSGVRYDWLNCMASCAAALLELSAVDERSRASESPRNVLCWGDSVTEGMAMPRGRDYPSRLAALLGPGYKVFNAGDGGENSITIPVRQGAVPIRTAAPIEFAADEVAVKIGDAGDNGFRTPAGDKIMLTAALGRQIPVNPVKIGQAEFRLSVRDFRWNSPTNRISYTLWLARDEGNGKARLSIPGGTPVKFASADAVADAYCEIFFMGANGGWGNDIGRLVAQVRAMIARRGESSPYLVVVPYWKGFSQEWKSAFKAAFGSHAVEFPVQDALCYKNRPDVHLNEKGYALLAELLHRRGAELGYWPSCGQR